MFYKLRELQEFSVGKSNPEAGRVRSAQKKRQTAGLCSIFYGRWAGRLGLVSIILYGLVSISFFPHLLKVCDLLITDHFVDFFSPAFFVTSGSRIILVR